MSESEGKRLFSVACMASRFTPEGMVERVAKAMYEAFGRESEFVGEYEFFDGATTLDGQFDLKEVARAAISAMREPTAGMSIAALSCERAVNLASDGQFEISPKHYWQSMIDAALSEDKPK